MYLNKNIDLEHINVYRIGPIAAFDKSAHSIHQCVFSSYFGRYGIKSYLYLRTNNGVKDIKKFFNFVGLDIDNKNFNVKISVKHKGFSSLQNLYWLLKDLYINKDCVNVIFLSKAKHVEFLSRFKKFLNFKLIFENHQNNLFYNAVKAADLNYIVSPYAYEKLKNLTNVIYWDYHYPVSDKFFKLRNKFSKKEKYLLGYIGSLNPEKGLEIVLAVLQLNIFKLKIIGGTDNQINKFKKLLQKHGVLDKVVFTGFVSQNKLIHHLKDVDILIAPFKRSQTSIPLKIYEYLATGLPIIASDIPAVRCVGKNYLFYFEPENSESFKNVLLELISKVDKVNTILIKSIQYSKSFRWDNVIAKILEDFVRYKIY